MCKNEENVIFSRFLLKNVFRSTFDLLFTISILKIVSNTNPIWKILTLVEIETFSDHFMEEWSKKGLKIVI